MSPAAFTASGSARQKALAHWGTRLHTTAGWRLFMLLVAVLQNGVSNHQRRDQGLVSRCDCQYVQLGRGSFLIAADSSSTADVAASAAAVAAAARAAAADGGGISSDESVSAASCSGAPVATSTAATLARDTSLAAWWLRLPLGRPPTETTSAAAAIVRRLAARFENFSN